MTQTTIIKRLQFRMVHNDRDRIGNTITTNLLMQKISYFYEMLVVYSRYKSTNIFDRALLNTL